MCFKDDSIHAWDTTSMEYLYHLPPPPLPPCTLHMGTTPHYRAFTTTQVYNTTCDLLVYIVYCVCVCVCVWLGWAYDGGWREVTSSSCVGLVFSTIATSYSASRESEDCQATHVLNT